jgi:hypothetical protein
MTPFLAWHEIAARRGDGLHPELAKLLKRPQAAAEADRPSVVTEGGKVVAMPTVKQVRP